ncbi:MAG: DNA repair protein RecN [Gammaproteobacteria bacterium]|nr:DNA repair protein RecN [Gammaproteobacteria bacterium]
MLRLLNIVNFAVIDRLQVELKPGLNVLSGETGSGKSIIIDALGLLLGDRSSPDLIRSGEERAFVEGVFDIQENSPLVDALSIAGIDVSEQEILIKRELVANGRGRIFINNQVANTGLLKSIQPHLVDIHGQGDQQSLLQPEVHLNLLDAFAGAAKNRSRVAQAYDNLQRVARELEQLRQSESERLQTLDMIDFQIAEIEQANLVENEDVELDVERNLLVNAEKLAELSGEAYRLLYEDEESILTTFAAVQKRLSDLAEVDNRFSTYLEQLYTVKYTLNDIAFFLGDYYGGIQASPERLRVVDDRLVELNKLKRKYGGSIEAVIETHTNLVRRKQQLLNSEEQSQLLEDELKGAIEEYEKESAVLSKLRQSCSGKFESALHREFRDISLGGARFSIRFGDTHRSQLAQKLQSLIGCSNEHTLRRTGKEDVEFYFSANVGEEMRPMSGVASGGELSRLMLALKTITSPTLFPKTLIFDEIDVGIGGSVADAVGMRLKRLAKASQVLCVTHQLQIARYADAHFLVSKGVVNGRTVTGVAELDEQGRVEELARMIGGSEVTASARKHAKELIKSASVE